jgi:hypothetical protein
VALLATAWRQGFDAIGGTERSHLGSLKEFRGFAASSRTAKAVGGIAHQHLDTTAWLLVGVDTAVVMRRLAFAAHHVLLRRGGAAFSGSLDACLDARSPHGGADAAQGVATVLALLANFHSARDARIAGLSVRRRVAQGHAGAATASRCVGPILSSAFAPRAARAAGPATIASGSVAAPRRPVVACRGVVASRSVAHTSRTVAGTRNAFVTPNAAWTLEASRRIRAAARPKPTPQPYDIR